MNTTLSLNNFKTKNESPPARRKPAATRKTRASKAKPKAKPKPKAKTKAKTKTQIKRKTKPQSKNIINPTLPTIATVDIDQFSDSSNESHVSNYLPSSDTSESDSSIRYAEPDDNQPTELEEMLLDGLINNDYSDEYLKELKVLEQRLQDKIDTGHFRCKVKHAKVYEQMTEIHNANTSDELLAMLNHKFDTQGVEAMNKSCSAYANKGETFSKTMSLTARLQIACATQIIGHHALWTRIYRSVGLPLGMTLTQYLRRKDKDKEKNHAFRRTKDYKTNRKIGWTNKYKVLREKQMNDNKNGLDYETGLAMTLARSRLKENKVERNPKGTPNKKLRCPYHHPNWCNVLGHNSMRDAKCLMRGKTPDILKAAKDEIQKDLVLAQMNLDSESSSKYC